MTTQRLNPLKALTNLLFSKTDNPEKPDMQSAVLASHEEARKAAAVFAESITRAHDLVQPIFGREPADNDAAVTFNGVAPKDGHYARYATFTVTEDGFNISVFQPTVTEPKDSFQIYVDDRGNTSAVIKDASNNLSHSIVAGNTSIGVVEAIGAWANRIFDTDTLAKIKKQSETVIALNQIRHPSIPGCWESPFSFKPV